MLRQPGHFSTWVLCGVLCAALLGIGAWAGAQWQAFRVADAASARPLAAGAAPDLSVRVQAGMTELATRLGQLQGRLIALEALRAQVVRSAGLDYSHPELTAAGATEGVPPATAQQVGQSIDRLVRQVDRTEDDYRLIAAALANQVGFHASLPTAAPIVEPGARSEFGWRRNPLHAGNGMHEGLDIAAPKGTPIHAASGGLVVRAGWVRGYGKMVELDHGNGLRTRYAHASSLNVKAGDIVRQGERVALVGSTGRATGPHLHYEVRMAGYPLDPAPFMRH